MSANDQDDTSDFFERYAGKEARLQFNQSRGKKRYISLDKPTLGFGWIMYQSNFGKSTLEPEPARFAPPPSKYAFIYSCQP